MPNLADAQVALTAKTSKFERKMSSAGDTAEETGDEMASITDDADELRQSTRKIAQAFARNFNSAEGDVDDLEDEVDGLIERLNDLDGKDVDVDIDQDVDGRKAGTVGRGIGEAVGMAGVIEEDMGRDIGEGLGRFSAAIGGTTSATIAAGAAISGVAVAAGAAAAGLAGAGGLAVKALQLANKFENAASPAVTAGLADLKNATTNLKKQFVSQMSPLLADTVIPALKGMAKEMEKVIPSLVEFAETWVPSLITMLKGWIQYIPNIIAGLETLMTIFAALWDASRVVTNVLRLGILKALDNLIGVFQEMAKAGVKFGDMIPGVDIDDSIIDGIESWDNPIEGLEDRVTKNITKSWDEMVANVETGFDALMETLGQKDTAGENKKSDNSLFQSEAMRQAQKAGGATAVQGAGLASIGGGGFNINAKKIGQKMTQQAKNVRREFNKTKKTLRNFTKVGKQALSSFANGVANAFNDAIFEGKNFLKSMKKVFKGLIKQLIAVAVKAAITAAVVAAIPGLNVGFAAAFTGVLKAGGSIGGAFPSTNSSAASSVTPSSGVATSSTQGMNINIQGESRTEGRDIVTSYEITKSDQRRMGRTARS